MPTTFARAEHWIKSGKATPFFRKGIFCVRLNVEPSNRHTQAVAVGIDPGSKREGYTVKSKAHTYLNQQFHAVDWVKDSEEASTNAVQGAVEKHHIGPIAKTESGVVFHLVPRHDGNSRFEW